jgi:prepilin signal peptidase PulO-like enzyme (type II secretory pathway)
VVAGQDVVLQSLLAVGFALIGMCMGSFASAIAARAPAGQSWISSKGKAERSRCPVCGHVLSWKDLIPLLSWISTLGKCRYCRTKISPLYPALELLGASVAVGVFLQGGAEGVGWDIAFRMAALPFAIANLVMVARRQKDLLTISLACFFYGCGRNF